MKEITVTPGPAWRWGRRAVQALAIFAIVVAPFLGGWQRLARLDLSSWNNDATEVPRVIRRELPQGAAARRAYDANQLIGGGTAMELAGIPAVDPILGALALITGPPTLRAGIAFLIPFLLAVVAGRVFCGWLCPFGTLSRVVAWILEHVPWRRRFELPTRRPVRFVVLAGGVIAGLLGVHVVLYLALPHLIVQQAIYAEWLLGGGGAALGLLIGFLLAGLLVGPTAYCATVCPTGAALRLAGEKRLVRLRIVEPTKCGRTCRRCSQACWLQLDPASGDPGPDCDLCARCVPVCPRTTLRVGFGRGEVKDARASEKKRPAKKVAAAAALVLAALSLASDASAQGAEAASTRGIRPELVLAGERVVDGVTVAVDAVDQTGVRLAADTGRRGQGTELSVFLARGERGEADERDMLPERDVYDGPLTVRVQYGGEERTIDFEAPTSPRSTRRRSIYRQHLSLRLEPGDRVIIEPVDGWLAHEVSMEVPTPGVNASFLNLLLWLVLGFGLALGSVSLALAVPEPRPA